MNVKLGVNIDHVATLRQSRRDTVPDPVDAARVCLGAGADMVVLHIRQDRRHMQDNDLSRLRNEMKGIVHLEMAATTEMEKLALSVKPDSVCIVPELKNEVTTQGGLKLSGEIGRLERCISHLVKADIGVSLFVDPDAQSVRTAHKLGADTVRLCTSRYSQARGQKKQSEELERLQLAGFLVKELKLHLHSGQGLDYHNAGAVSRIAGMECLNIGYSIICRALFVGLKTAVTEMRRIIQ